MTDLKTIEFNILKKNRMYFAAKNAGGYACKIKITPESENIEPGVHALVVEDLSVRSKYGTDLIYAVQADIKETGIVTLQHFAFNQRLVDSCRKLGGKWDADSKSWVFSAIVADAVEDLDCKWNSEISAYEITAKDQLSSAQDSVHFCGYPIATATGRDSGAKLHDGVAQMSGRIRSGGSVKNWTSVVEEGSIFRLNLPAHYAVDNDYWVVVKI